MVSLEDWAFGMKGLNPDSIITLKTNNGRFVNVKAPPGVGSAQGLSADSIQMFRAAKNDTMAAFVTSHPTWIASN